MTPATLGSAVARRRRMIMSARSYPLSAPGAERAPSLALPGLRGREGWGVGAERADRLFGGMRGNSCLHQLPVVELAVEPVAVAGHMLLHCNVEERIEQRDPWDLGERHRDVALDRFRVFLRVGFEPGSLDQLIHCRV